MAITYPFQQNDGGRADSLRPKEKNDCTVRALAIAFGMNYDLAYEILAACGRTENKGFHFRKWLGKRRAFNGFRITWESFPAVKGQRRMNPVTFAKQFRRGRYLCRTAHHVYAVIEGVVQDKAPEYDERCIYGAYRLDPITARARAVARAGRDAKRKAVPHVAVADWVPGQAPKARRRKAAKRRRADLTPPPPGAVRRPRVGPCRDLLELWFLETEADGGVWRHYYGDGPEARAALKHYRATGEFLPSGTSICRAASEDANLGVQ